jgi:hypothetical protein
MNSIASLTGCQGATKIFRGALQSDPPEKPAQTGNDSGVNRWLPRGVTEEARNGLDNSSAAQNRLSEDVYSGEINQKSAQGRENLAL